MTTTAELETLAAEIFPRMPADMAQAERDAHAEAAGYAAAARGTNRAPCLCRTLKALLVGSTAGSDGWAIPTMTAWDCGYQHRLDAEADGRKWVDGVEYEAEATGDTTPDGLPMYWLAPIGRRGLPLAKLRPGALRADGTWRLGGWSS